MVYGKVQKMSSILKTLFETIFFIWKHETKLLTKTINKDITN